uniref:Uncharacterized protein n=1 Tax=Mucochytrium quahogii TaxID=96639 RepID=A0A7S2WRH2_9STRA|mmetsp:Transcript_19816/g.32561  ORF Transcript_19816/g.32561 Transcript_19816/m.32561 type:complete len:129 (-) Transcript_19816:595-981(-)
MVETDPALSGLATNFAGSTFRNEKGFHESHYGRIQSGRSFAQFSTMKDDRVSVTSKIEYMKDGVPGALLRDVTTPGTESVAALETGEAYFSVMDTTEGGGVGCTFTVRNVELAGQVPAGQCKGFNIWT